LKTRAKRTRPPAVTPHVTPEPADRVSILARAVALVAGMEGLTDAERAAVLDRVVADAGTEARRP
jgi:hypothetical protein